MIVARKVRTFLLLSNLVRVRHSADLHISLYIFTFLNRLIEKTFILELIIILNKNETLFLLKLSHSKKKLSQNKLK